MTHKYIVRYVTDDDPRSKEVIMLAGDEQDAKKQLEDEFLDIVDYINVLSITNQASAKESRKEAETYFS